MMVQTFQAQIQVPEFKTQLLTGPGNPGKVLKFSVPQRAHP